MRRRQGDAPSVALVGYTNAGKTTLFNRLAREEAQASDALFVTLDPLVRRVRLGDGQFLFVSDTVGFIERLPHTLVASFHATLEEVVEADLLLHVVDASSEDLERRMEAVRQVLAEVGAQDVPVLLVMNKSDRLDPADRRRLRAQQPGAVVLSALTGEGVEALTAAVGERLGLDTERVTLEFDVRLAADRARIAWLYRVARVISHHTEGTRAALQPAQKVATVFMTNSNGIDSRAFALTANDIVGPALKQAVENPGGAKPHDPALARYTGRYDNWLAGETWVVPWDDGLALIELPSSQPMAELVKLRPTGEHRFRRIRDDGGLAEEVRFDLAADGTPVRVWRHINYDERPAGSRPGP